MKAWILSFILLCGFSLEGSVYYSNELKPSIEKIYALPESSELLQKVEQQGPLIIIYESCPGYPYFAHWNGQERTITINSDKHPSEGQIIQSVIFELNNALDAHELSVFYSQAENGALDKEAFVEGIERMEHRHTLDTAALLKKGIDQKIFPENALWPSIVEFRTYYQIQQLTGHSQWLAERYDQVAPANAVRPFRGTVNLDGLSKEDRFDIAFYLGIRDYIRNSRGDQKQKYLNKLNQEYKQIAICLATNSAEAGCVRAERRSQLLESIFAQDFKQQPLIYAQGQVVN